jgi:hypothetical protein
MPHTDSVKIVRGTLRIVMECMLKGSCSLVEALLSEEYRTKDSGALTSEDCICKPWLKTHCVSLNSKLGERGGWFDFFQIDHEETSLSSADMGLSESRVGKEVYDWC